MQSLRGLPLRAQSILAGGRSLRACQPRRYAHDEHSDSHGHGHDHGPAPPENESFGRGFFIALAAIPLSIAVYQFTANNGAENSMLTSLGRAWTASKESVDKRNNMHTEAVSVAARDRALFFNGSEQEGRRLDLRFPEALNTGSPFNVPAGRGSSNIDYAIEKYTKMNYEATERRHQQLRDNKVPSEHPLEESR